MGLLGFVKEIDNVKKTVILSAAKDLITFASVRFTANYSAVIRSFAALRMTKDVSETYRNRFVFATSSSSLPLPFISAFSA